MVQHRAVLTARLLWAIQVNGAEAPRKSVMRIIDPATDKHGKKRWLKSPSGA